MHDLIIQGGVLVDGTGGAPRTGDIAIRDGVISALGGRIAERSYRVIGADGLLVTPGFVDIHSHYDGQVTWDDTLDPSASHGVTTTVMGNCGVGFAPVRPGGEDELIKLMEGVEDIPGAALHEGIEWSWNSFPEYLNALAKRRYSMDIGTQIPHGALRAFVMGERGLHNGVATAADVSAMADLVTEAVRAGALGVSSSRSEAHQSVTGEAVPGTFAGASELIGLAQGMQRGGGGVFEVIPTLMDGYTDPKLSFERTTTEDDVDMLRKVSLATGCKLTYLLLQNSSWPEAWREVLRRSDAANAAGAKLTPQVAGRPTGTMIGLSSYHIFQRRPAYLKIAALPLAERVREMRRPEVKAAILGGTDAPPLGVGWLDNVHTIARHFLDKAFPVQKPINYEPTAAQTLSGLAHARGISIEEVTYDEMLADDGNAFVMFYALGYQYGDFSALEQMLRHPATVLGLCDGGAHTRFICDASVQTFMLSHWGRDRSRGATMPVELIIKKQTADTAALYGLHDRGSLALGYRADVNLIDHAKLAIGTPKMTHDLPAGGGRILQSASGYVATLVKGCVTRDCDRDTGERPGRLVRRGSAL